MVLAQSPLAPVQRGGLGVHPPAQLQEGRAPHGGAVHGPACHTSYRQKNNISRKKNRRAKFAAEAARTHMHTSPAEAKAS